MSKIILVRHGRTAWHAEGRYAGTADVKLDEAGREQVARVVERLSGVEFAAIYTSPLSRCHELAAAVAADHGMEPVTDPRLGEIDLGRWDGETFQEIIEKDGEMLKRWTEDPTSVTVPGGESLISVQDRAMAWFAEATMAHPDALIMASSHGGPIRAIVSAVLGLPLAHLFRLTIDLASITTINYKGMFSNLEEMNDRCHLAGLDAHTWL
ncbi:MAG: alpha-ribazole phosphatase [Candidatus Geothermincolia bacterium]